MACRCRRLHRGTKRIRRPALLHRYRPKRNNSLSATERHTIGSSFTVSGTVLDASPGTKNPTQKALFPNGVPAVSEASQEEFMEYLYEQQPKPASATGVPVSIDAIDPNRNLVHIGDATSDSSGFYCLGVNTNILGAGPGIYKVVATFAGSNSYAPSSAECAFNSTLHLRDLLLVHLWQLQR